MANSGLTQAQADAALKEHGLNELTREEGRSPWTIFILQFQSPLIWLLMLASGLAFVLGDYLDAIAISVILLINSGLGFFQEYRAEKAVIALRDMTSPHARVLRDGRLTDVQSKCVVPGDILMLEAGDIIAADADILESHGLKTNEASLTGESQPVDKVAGGYDPKLPLGDQKGRAFSGTHVVKGTGKALVKATGMKSELGKIAHLLNTAQQEVTPLQKNLSKVGNTLLYLCLGIVVLIATLEFFRGQGWMDIALTAVAMAVAAVPEGLPAIVTIALSFGVQRMAAKHVLIRKLPSVETLGSATVICTDKTGTLTTGKMIVRDVWGKNHEAVIRTGVGCCDAELKNSEEGTGDPTEIAILKAGLAYELDREQIEKNNPRVKVYPFDTETKRMAILRQDGKMYVKGALESLLPLTSSGTEGVDEANTEFAKKGLRVLAVAEGEGEALENLSLIGLIGIADPPREEAIRAINSAREAGIKTVMITGDHPVTARAIAQEMGIVKSDDKTDEFVHARATPEDKINIVRKWKDRGDIVAMTGDGVNDAPALREAHIGIAMGITGTEVTKEASHMILTDDNYASIVGAIREGRGIFENIQKSILYLLTGNSSELLLMLGASLFFLPLPLVPIHLLWINLVTESFPALALITEPLDEDILKRPPRDPSKGILGKEQWKLILSWALLEGGICLAVYYWMLKTRGQAEAVSITFSCVVMSELLRSFAARSQTKVIPRLGFFTNKWLVGVVSISIIIQISMHHIPVTQKFLHITPLSVMDHMLTFGVGVLVVTCMELRKILLRGRSDA